MTLRSVPTYEPLEYPYAGLGPIAGEIQWPYRRWLSSDFCLKASCPAQAAFLQLVFHAFDQFPAGTLPTDRLTLSKLIRVDSWSFENLCAQEYGPLYGWVPCLCSGEVRLTHPLVLEAMEATIGSRGRTMGQD